MVHPLQMKMKQGILFLMQWLLLIKFSAAITRTCVNEYCFISPNPTALSQYDARNWCIGNGAQLIEITNSSVQNATSQLFTSLRTEIGNSSPFTNGKKLTLPSWSRITGSGIDSSIIRNQYDASYACLYMIRSNSITSLMAGRTTDSKQGYICQGESLCSASNGFLLNSICYKRYTTTLSWYEARNRCLMNGGDLASFDSITTADGFNVINETWLQSDNTYWIGIRREIWKWQSTNSEITFSNWNSGSPVIYINDPYDCLCLDPQYNWPWSACRCNDRHSFICISASGLTTSTTTSTTTSATSTGTTMKISVENNNTDDTSHERQDNILSYPPLPASVSMTTWPSDNSEIHHGKDDNLSTRTAIGIGVGVGAGVVVVAGAIVIVVIIIRKRYHKRTEKKKQEIPLQPPDIIAHQTIENNSNAQEENPYVTVVKQSKNEETSSAKDKDVNPTQNIIYADLQFLSKVHKDRRKESINLVNETSESSQSLSQPLEEEDMDPKEKECNNELQDTVTRA